MVPGRSKLPQRFGDLAGDPDDAFAPATRLARDDAANYIADLAAELADMARAVKLDLVAYLLDIARLEAMRSLDPIKSDAG
jgi:hypothetical protein